MSEQVQKLLDDTNDAANKLKALMDHAVDVARGTIEAGDENLPTWILQNAKGCISIFITPWSNDKEKDIISILIRSQIKVTKAIRLVFVSECWIVQTKVDEDIHCQPMHHPLRKEFLMVTGEGINGEMLIHNYPILRPSNKLGEVIKNDDFESGTGRFINMF
jgi:hypothetical protein